MRWFGQPIHLQLKRTSFYITVPAIIIKSNGIKEFSPRRVMPNIPFHRIIEKEINGIDSILEYARKFASE